MTYLLEKIICFFKGHDSRFVGFCPFTKRSYKECLRCQRTFLAVDFSEEIDKEEF